MTRHGSEILPSGIRIDDSAVDSFYISDGLAVIRISKQDIFRMHEIAYPDITNKLRRRLEYQNDSVLIAFRSQLADLLNRQAMPGIPYPEDVRLHAIPYAQAQAMIEKIITVHMGYAILHYSDVINFDNETT